VSGIDAPTMRSQLILSSDCRSHTTNREQIELSRLGKTVACMQLQTANALANPWFCVSKFLYRVNLYCMKSYASGHGSCTSI